MIGAVYVNILCLAIFIAVPWNTEAMYGRKHEKLIVNGDFNNMEGGGRCLL
jgi:hypothetical protein